MNYRITLAGWNGRLCNNITQLCNAIHFAKQTASILVVPPHSGWLQTRSFDFSNGQRCRRRLKGSFFNLKQEGLGEFSLDWETRREILATHLRPLLPSGLFPGTAGDELVIHIRSGDIFNRSRKDLHDAQKLAPVLGPLLRSWRKWRKGHAVHPDFVQPPFSFYQRILDSAPWSSVRLVAEDQENPVVPQLLQRYDHIQFDPASLEIDVAYLLGARHLVIGYGTFGITWALLSQHLRAFYTPSLPAVAMGEIPPGCIGPIRVHPFRFVNYIPRGQWKATAEQRELMLTHSTQDVIELGVSQVPAEAAG